MDFHGVGFPGISTPDRVTLSQRNYSYDPLGSLSQQSTHFVEPVGPSADNLTYVTPFTLHRGHDNPGLGGNHGHIPVGGPDGFLGNIQLFKPGWFSMPGWYGAMGVGGCNNNWDDLRQQGVGYGLYAPHMPQHPIPAHKLYEPGGGFVVPASFLGQPLVAMAAPPGA